MALIPPFGGLGGFGKFPSTKFSSASFRLNKFPGKVSITTLPEFIGISGIATLSGVI